MDDPRSVIERSLSRVGSESYTLESFYRRRDRKRTRQRLAAGVVGLAIAVTIAVTGSAILRSAPDHLPADTRGTPILREGAVLQVVDENGPMATLVATDPATGHQRNLHACSGRCGYIPESALSAERGWVAWEQACGGGTVHCSSGLWVVGADGSTIHVTPSAHPPGQSWIWAWSPAADQIALVTGRSGLAEVVLFDPSTGERTSVTTIDGISALSWSPDGTAIALASPSSGVSIIDLATGRSTSIARIGAVDDHDLSWSPDGTRLLLETHSRIIVVNADGSDRRVLVVNADGSGAPAWSPDGTRIAYIGTSGPGRRASPEVWVTGADGSDATRVFHAECCHGDGSGPVWSPDGSRIAFWIHVVVPFNSQLVVNADGTGSPEQVDDVMVDGWIQG
jgi:dipeptidyl aminopeptidase/acylaminoacyl peptidase